MKRFFKPTSLNTQSTRESRVSEDCDAENDIVVVTPAPATSRIEYKGIKEFRQEFIIADPGLRISIDEFDHDIRDEVRRAYVLKGPTQPIGHTFPKK